MRGEIITIQVLAHTMDLQQVAQPEYEDDLMYQPLPHSLQVSQI